MDAFRFALAHPGVRVSVRFDSGQQSFVVRLTDEDVRGHARVVRNQIGALEWNDFQGDLGEVALDDMAAELKYG